ncbi:MAG: hypothetical protein MJ237_09740, partial [bacterium]|nr:hypothetical protein [bacterium]
IIASKFARFKYSVYFCTKDDTKELTDRQRVILNVIEKDCTITAQKIAQKGYAVGQRTLMTELSALQSFGVLHRVGTHKNGRWVIEKRK